jgi:hypothetical protein
MKITWLDREIIYVKDGADFCEEARLEGMRRGIEFRESELAYDVLPAWVCKDCGKRVWAENNVCRGYSCVYSELHELSLCERCLIARDKIQSAVNSLVKKTRECLKGRELEELVRLAHELWERNEEGDRRFVENFVLCGLLTENQVLTGNL